MTPADNNKSEHRDPVESKGMEASGETPSSESPKPWLIAAWPGMGNVAMIAAAYLVRGLDMTPIAELRTNGFFDIQAAVIRNGMVGKPRPPHCVIYRWKNPVGRDLYVFMGGAQPTSGSYSFAEGLLEHVAEYNVERVITFASLVTQAHPSAPGRVAGIATSKKMLAELNKGGIEIVKDGEVGGLNGVLLAAAAQRGLPGIGLLGEVPVYAVGMQNPKGALAVLQTFSEMTGISLDLEELQERSKAAEEAMLEMMEQNGAGGEQQEFEPEFDSEGTEPEADEPEVQAEPEGLDQAEKARVESLFREASENRAKIVELKQELDRVHAFRLYEDRFLDLFKKAG
jgi:proteasome assembly chaperone (PAC2) family protein